jgi:hypothetical protein
MRDTQRGIRRKGLCASKNVGTNLMVSKCIFQISKKFCSTFWTYRKYLNINHTLCALSWFMNYQAIILIIKNIKFGLQRKFN